MCLIPKSIGKLARVFSTALRLTPALILRKSRRPATWLWALFCCFSDRPRPLSPLRLHRTLGSWAGRRGDNIFDALLRDGSLPPGFRTIDNFTNGIATSIKSIDLNAATYQDAARLTARLNNYIDQLADYEGGQLLDFTVDPSKITD